MRQPARPDTLGLARYYLGDVAGAREMLLSARQGGQPDVRSQASLASVAAATGDKTAARQEALAIEKGPYMDHHVASTRWAPHGLSSGEPATSVRWLSQAVDTGFPCYPLVSQGPVRSARGFAATAPVDVLTDVRERLRVLLGL